MVIHNYFPVLWPKLRRRNRAAKAPPRNALRNECQTFDSPSYWGSTEEHEIQQILQRIISGALDANLCREALNQLHGYLQTASDGWVDRFSVCQGTLVLKKLLRDINSTEAYMQLRDLKDYAPERMGCELAIVKCLSAVFSRSSVARQLALEDKSQSMIHTLLRSALSPNEHTRQIASATLERLKGWDGSSNMLKLLSVRRSPSNSNRIDLEMSDLPSFGVGDSNLPEDGYLDTKNDWNIHEMLGPLFETNIPEPIGLNIVASNHK